MPHKHLQGGATPSPATNFKQAQRSARKYLESDVKRRGGYVSYAAVAQAQSLVDMAILYNQQKSRSRRTRLLLNA